ncbi:MAG: DUF4097 family beta strand repeat protein [Clostridia bacterium]|nr:DUF4097 family beta strand repeat protein [Clostridia bacterium]
MRRRTTGWLIAAALLIVLGLACIAAAMTANAWDFSHLRTERYETTTHQISESFHSISLRTDTADIDFLPADDGGCRVVCEESVKAKHSAAVRSGTLTVSVKDERKWYDHIGIGFSTPKITVYLPKDAYTLLTIKGSTGDITVIRNFRFANIDISVSTGDVVCQASADEQIIIKTNTGDITVRELSADALDLTVSTGTVQADAITCGGDMTVRVSTGRANLRGVSCRNLRSTGSTGRIVLQDVIAAELISLERSTGEIHFDSCDAAALSVKTSTGDVTGSLRTEKLFFAESDTGDIDLPRTTTGGKCEIVTSTGDIRLTVQKGQP